MSGYLVPLAIAASIMPAPPAADLNRAIEVARAAYPASPCNGREVYRVVDRIDDAGDTRAQGAATASSCAVELATRRRGPLLCGLVVHEHGHLAGLAHSDDPADVMHSSAPAPPACEPTARELSRAWVAVTRHVARHWHHGTDAGGCSSDDALYIRCEAARPRTGTAVYAVRFPAGRPTLERQR